MDVSSEAKALIQRLHGYIAQAKCSTGNFFDTSLLARILAPQNYYYNYLQLLEDVK
jgi:hypothetical protein